MSVVQGHMVSAFARRSGWLLLEEREAGEYVHSFWLTPAGHLMLVVLTAEGDVWTVTTQETWEPRHG